MSACNIIHASLEKKKNRIYCDVVQLRMRTIHVSMRLQGKLHFHRENLLYDVKKERTNHIMEYQCVSLFKYVSLALGQFSLY